MSVGSPTAGTWSSSQWRPDNEFETDSTGLSIVGAGEWAAAKHGGRGVAGGNSTLASISPA